LRRDAKYRFIKINNKHSEDLLNSIMEQAKQDELISACKQMIDQADLKEKTFAKCVE
jgi:hypothetical protein